jgi:hypothetical protein
MQLAADLAPYGIGPYAQGQAAEQEAPRSLAEETAPDLSDLDQQIDAAEQHVQQHMDMDRQQEQEREQ